MLLKFIVRFRCCDDVSLCPRCRVDKVFSSIGSSVVIDYVISVEITINIRLQKLLNENNSLKVCKKHTNWREIVSSPCQIWVMGGNQHYTQCRALLLLSVLFTTCDSIRIEEEVMKASENTLISSLLLLLLLCWVSLSKLYQIFYCFFFHNYIQLRIHKCNKFN